MTEHVQAQHNVAARVQPAGPAKRSTSKELVVPQATFDWLRRFQQEAPSPRLELRSYVEGAIKLLDSDPSLRAALLLEAKSAMFHHLGQQLGRDLTEELTEALSRNSGQQPGVRTAAPSGASEGANHARTQGQGMEPAVKEPPCKALHVGDITFGALKSLQDTSRDPRVGLRYLLEGAIRLLEKRRDLHMDWVRHARAAMQAHLQELQQ